MSETWGLPTATVEEQVAFLAWMVGWPEERVGMTGQRSWRSVSIAGGGNRVLRIAKLLDERGLEAFIGLSSEGSAPVLWCWVEGSDQVWRAGRFRPMPSVVLRMGKGSRRLLLWGLQESVGFQQVAPANRRIAYALHASQKYAEPEMLRVPLPGSFLREGRKKPVPVLMTRLEVESFTREQVVGRLRDPPPKDRWRERR